MSGLKVEIDRCIAELKQWSSDGPAMFIPPQAEGKSRDFIIRHILNKAKVHLYFLQELNPYTATRAGTFSPRMLRPEGPAFFYLALGVANRDSHTPSL